MRFLLDTNILIPLEDSQVPLRSSLANFVRLARENGHQLVYHPASEDDIKRDSNLSRRKQTLDRLKQYTRVECRLFCPWNSRDTGKNDASDNEILYSICCDAAHALVTEDRGIHDNAVRRGLGDRVYTIQTAEDWLRRLHEQVPVLLPNIEEVSLYSLTPQLGGNFFDSLRDAYPGFDGWFRAKAREDRRAWVSWDEAGALGAICIYVKQLNQTITQDGLLLSGAALKLSTFKVAPLVRGRKIGELFLKAAFRYASLNSLENIFIHGDLEEHHFLFELLEDFGFVKVGIYPGTNGRDASYLKRHPVSPPKDEDLPSLEYFRRYFPHYKNSVHVKKYVVPIQPRYHRVLFPDYRSSVDKQLRLFEQNHAAGNAIKQAYLCHAPLKKIGIGDIVLFYRSEDERAITSLGVVEEYETLMDPSVIARLVSRRTVYSMNEIEAMATKPTRVMLFRIVRHFNNPISHEWLQANGVVNGNIQTILPISDESFEMINRYAGK